MEAEVFKAGEPVVLRGVAVVGWSGLKRVEYWVRPDTGKHGVLDDEDPAWKSAEWKPCQIEPPPENWGGNLPDGVMPKDVWGFDLATGKPKDWPLRFSTAQWTATLPKLPAGAYEFRARTVDLNGFAQPEPRPYPKSGTNRIMGKTFVVME